MPQGLSWGRLESGWRTNRKFRALRDRKAWRSIVVYWCALGYAIEHGTDGWIAPGDLAEVWATGHEVELLVDVGLWDLTPDDNGWLIHDYGEFQQLASATAAKRDHAVKAARARWDGHR